MSREACIGSFISVDKLEQIVIGELNRLSEEYLNKEELEKNIEPGDNLQARKEQALANIAAYEKRAAELSRGIRELYMDKVKGRISAGDFAELSLDFTAERERLERLISDGHKETEELDIQIKAGENRQDIVERYTHLKHLNREMVEFLIDYISIGRRIPGTQNVPVEIHWNF